jgi:PAS domain S-box-containing protein
MTNPSAFLAKPFADAELKNCLEIVLHRHRSEANQRLYQRAMAASVSAVFIVDARLTDRPIIQVNAAFESMTGYSAAEAMGRSCSFLEGPETNAATVGQLREAFECYRTCRVTLLYYRKDGASFWSELTVSPVPDHTGRVTHFVGVQHDVTSVRSLESQLRQAQKLESIGQLAAGIAHEINTPMQYIGDNTRFLSGAFAHLRPYFEAQARLLEAARTGRVEPEIIAAAASATQSADIDYLVSEIPQSITQTLEGIERVTSIVKAMKEFSHPGVEEMVNVDINHAIESTLTVCRNEWKYVANVVTDFDPDLPLVSCLPGELNQVFLNLIVNASHAIGDVVEDGGLGKGTISVRTRRAGTQVEIQFGDTGTGIPENVRHRIFDPFFTTKKVGQGTGQGLAIAWSVIKDKHHGDIRVDTEMGQGTTFTISLPVSPASSLSTANAA